MRKKRADKRRTMPDPRFNDVMVAKFVNNIMIQGKKNTARRLVYEALDIVGKKTEQDPLEIFRRLYNVFISLSVKSPCKRYMFGKFVLFWILFLIVRILSSI